MTNGTIIGDVVSTALFIDGGHLPGMREEMFSFLLHNRNKLIQTGHMKTFPAKHRCRTIFVVITFNQKILNPSY